tara:strand:- start:5348 stop:5539 length:192 start_codon:yes stop_codon:yes gene_type:complete
MNRKRTIEVQEIKVRATCGSNLTDCIVEAIILACEENNIVTLIHNGKSYKVDPVKVVHKIQDQ